MSNSKKRRYNDSYEERDYLPPIVVPSYSFAPALTLERKILNMNYSCVKDVQQSHDIYTADQPCTLSNLVFDLNFLYDANQYKSVEGIFYENPTPKICWSIVIHTNTAFKGTLSSPDSSGVFYAPEQKLWRGGIQYLEPVYYQRETIHLTQEANTSINFSSSLFNTSLTQAGSTPNTINGTVNFPDATFRLGNLSGFSQNTSNSEEWKRSNFRGYSSLGKNLKVGDKLLLILNSNFNCPVTAKVIVLNGVINWDKKI